MRKYLISILLIFWMLPAEAQLFSREKVINNPNFDMPKWSWGYFLGFNTYDLDFNYKKEIVDGTEPINDFIVNRQVGFNVGLIGNMRINNNLDLRLEPGVAFNTIKFEFPDLPAGTDPTREIRSTYVHIPLLLKYSADRINNFKPFIVGGLSTSFNLSSNENNPDDNSEGQFRVKTHTYYWEVGFGVDLYLFYFKFSPSIRGIFAINDQLVRDEAPDSIYTGNVDIMRSRGVFLNFTFQ